MTCVYKRSGFPSGSMVKNLPEVQKRWVSSLGGENSLKKEMATHSCILAWESHGQRSLEGYSPWGHKESDTTEKLSNNFMAADSPEVGMVEAPFQFSSFKYFSYLFQKQKFLTLMVQFIKFFFHMIVFSVISKKLLPS